MVDIRIEAGVYKGVAAQLCSKVRGRNIGALHQSKRMASSPRLARPTLSVLIF
jgi:hypothetical protein